VTPPKFLPVSILHKILIKYYYPKSTRMNGRAMPFDRLMIAKIISSAVLFSGCQTMTLEERMARKVGCDPTGVGVLTPSESPWHAVRIVTCRKEKERYKCVEAPYTENCKPYSEADEKRERAEKKAKKDKKKKKS
jgi:hypothetical protein